MDTNTTVAGSDSNSLIGKAIITTGIVVGGVLLVGVKNRFMQRRAARTTTTEQTN